MFRKTVHLFDKEFSSKAISIFKYSHLKAKEREGIWLEWNIWVECETIFFEDISAWNVLKFFALFSSNPSKSIWKSIVYQL